MSDDRDFQEIEKIRRPVERENVLIAFYEQKGGIEFNKFFRESRKDVVDINNRREPEPYLEDDSRDLLEIPYEYMKNCDYEPKRKCKDLLNDVYKGQQKKNLMNRRAARYLK